jgi:hypothetical protein
LRLDPSQVGACKASYLACAPAEMPLPMKPLLRPAYGYFTAIRAAESLAQLFEKAAGMWGLWLAMGARW